MNPLGPVFAYDLLRLARRARFFILRFAFALLVFAALFLCHLAFQERVRMRAAGGVVVRGAFYSSNLARGNVQQAMAREMANFGLAFFAFFLLMEFGLILLAAPAIVAGSVVEEKQRQTLEYLLATDLTNREIVVGKLLSRLLTLGCMVLAGYPILAGTYLLGGVDPELLLLSLPMCLATMLSASGISLYFSVKARRLRGALGAAYVALLALTLAWFVPLALAEAKPLWMSADVQNALRLVADGGKFLTPLGILFDFVEWFDRRGTLAGRLWPMCGAYCLIHVMLAGLFAMMAVRQLRTAYLAQHALSAREAKRLQRRVRPQVWPNAPLAWKELTGWGGLRLRWWGWGLVMLLTLMFMGPTLFDIGYLAVVQGHPLPERMSGYYMYLGGPFGRTANPLYQKLAELRERLPWFVLLPLVLGLLQSGIRGAASFAQEREQQTWDGLIAAPLKLRDLLRAKWLGCLHAARGPFFFAASFYGLAALLHVAPALSALLGSLALAVYFAAAGMLGLFFSAAAATALRAMLATLILLALFCILPLVAMGLLASFHSSGDIADGILAALDLASWSWVPGLAAIAAVVAAKFSPPKVRVSLLFLVKSFLIGLPILIVGLMLMMAFATAFGISYSVGELFGFLSPLYVCVLCIGQAGFRLNEGEALAGSVVALGLYAGSAWVLWGLTRWRLRKASGRVDGMKPKRIPARAAEPGGPGALASVARR